jgi:uncharacterized protein (TIGR02757 family)
MRRDHDLKMLLERNYRLYARKGFIEHDPISIPHIFSRKEDIEIAAFLTATIAWGNRKSIIANSRRLVMLMDDAPYDFVMNFETADLQRFNGFVHRTFSAEDCRFFLRSLQKIYRQRHGLESCFSIDTQDAGLARNIIQFREVFLSTRHKARSEKHISDPAKNSACKRLCMFLRWMVRSPKEGVDFGIWKSIRPSQLMLPMDVHASRVARQLGLLTRKQNDWKAVEEVTANLRQYDPLDPVKYDFALFGAGVSGV